MRPRPVGGSVRVLGGYPSKYRAESSTARPSTAEPTRTVGGVRSTATPPPRNVGRPSSTTSTPSARDIYDRAGRRGTATVRPRDVVSSGVGAAGGSSFVRPRGSVRTTVSTASPAPSRTSHYAGSRVTTAPSPVLSPRATVRGNPAVRSISTGSSRPNSGAPVLLPRTTTLSPRGATRSIASGIVGSRGYTGYGGYRGYGSSYCGRLGSVYTSWWNPCSSFGYRPSSWSLRFGRGCYGFGLSLWYPWYLSTSLCWSGYYRSCWWSSVCRPTYYDYWWYPSSTYCPTYLYVPSTTVVYADAGDGGDGGVSATAAEAPDESAAAAAKAATEGAADLAAKYVELGDFYFKAGRFSEAEDAYARARSYAPDDAALHFVLADAAFAVGDYHFAAFLIAEALRLDPTLARAEADKRDFYGDPKLFDEHMAALEKYLADKEYDASAHLVRGYNLRFSDRDTAAIAAFRRVLEIAPDHRAARLFLEALAPTDEPSASKPTIR
ncbi:MAG: tetratricopeptide repeat protein [Planctomycetes bacterium]|nr:tetratricopeptide repeat protein [Planctomycetota bacterium]